MDADRHVLNQSVIVGNHHYWEAGWNWPDGTVGPIVHRETIVPNQITGDQFSGKHKRVKGVYRSGGSWIMWQKKDRTRLSNSIKCYRPGYALWYEGCFRPAHHLVASMAPDGWNTEASLKWDLSNLSSRGAEAWNRLRPDEPDFSMATSLYELKDFLPLARKSVLDILHQMNLVPQRKKGKRNSEISRSGQFYLAAEFGWIPLLKDIQNYIEAHKESQKRLTQLIRDAGKPVRRRTELKDADEWKRSSYVQWGYDGNVGAYVAPIGVTQCHYFNETTGLGTTTSVSRKTWAMGKFVYHLPPGPRDVAWNRKMYKRIMGHRITPRELYQVMPWSWFIDYYTTLGEFVDAVSPGVADSLYCEYAYLMQTTTYSLYSVANIGVYYTRAGNAVTGAHCGKLTEQVIKLRVAASPFGWGINQRDLSLKQQAIQSALMLSRLP